MKRWSLLLLAALCCFSGLAHAAAKRITLPNGLRVIVEPHTSTEVVAIEVLLDLSAAEESWDQSGLRYLTQRVLLRGTRSETGKVIARRLAEAGGAAEARVGLDYVEVYALVPSDGFETALDIIANALQSPAFDPEELAGQREEAQAIVRDSEEDGFQATYLALRESFYPNHPYGALTYGTPATLAGLSDDMVMDLYARCYLPNRTVLAICGGIGELRAIKAAKAAFGDWAIGLPNEVPVPAPAPLTQSDLTVRERKVNRAYVMLGFPAPPASAPDYFAVQVLDAVLGGGSTGRLQHSLREELGLVYEASTFYPTLAGQSHLVIYAVTESGNLEVIQQAVLELTRDLAQHPVSAAELARAKGYLLGSYALSHQRMKEQAYALAWYELLGLGVDFEERYRQAISSVTAAQVQQAATAVFQHYVMAVTLPQE